MGLEDRVDPKELEPGQGPGYFYHMSDGGLIRQYNPHAPGQVARPGEQWICVACSTTWHRETVERMPTREKNIRFGHVKAKDELTYVMMEGLHEGKLVHKLVWSLGQAAYEKMGWRRVRVTEWP